MGEFTGASLYPYAGKALTRGHTDHSEAAVTYLVSNPGQLFLQVAGSGFLGSDSFTSMPNKKENFPYVTLNFGL